jgi:hypothetical protein
MDIVSGKRLICYEANEIPLRIFRWFAQMYPRSTVATIMAQSTVVETVTSDTGHLSPWITWPTMHRGVINETHAIHDFGQDLTAVNQEYPSVWELLSRGGVRVGLFGSLQSYPLPANVEDYAFYVPDTFAAGPECFPENLSAFQKFNLAMVDGSGRNVSKGLPLRDAAKFLAAAPGLGLRGVTIAKLANQLASERVRPNRVVRRRTSQMQIGFDFFLKELKRTTPEAAFFFTNHVASSMHRYWPATFPNDYKNDVWSGKWKAEFSDEIACAMRELDAQLATLVGFVRQDPRYALAISSSMGQGAVEGELIRSQLLLSDIGQLMRTLEMPAEKWRQLRAMAPLYMISVPNETVADFEAKLSLVRINGASLDYVHRGEGVFRIALGQANLNAAEIKVLYGNREVQPAELGMTITNIQDETGSYAYHVPEGSLLIFDPAKPGREVPRQMNTLEYAPALLRNFGLRAPSYMVS